MRYRLMAATLAASGLVLGGCAPLVGAGVVGGAYEYNNQQALEALEDKFEAGEISKREYLERREEIQGRSLVY